MGNSTRPRTEEKALAINLDESKYGTFAEIGAGQEVANWFFRASATAGTVAKAMSAYDMTFSDSIYGECKRYVSRARLLQMLDHEYNILIERLSLPRGERSTFFVFANTVRAMPYHGGGECHGWLGIRLQLAPLAEPHTILIHVRLLDQENLDQMEALGIVGVNLIYAAFFYRDNLKLLAESLLDDLSRKRVEIDMLKFNGPGFKHIDNRLCALQLVESELTDAAMFLPDGEVVQPAEVLYRKRLLLMRGSFNPVTLVHLDMMNSARKAFEESAEVETDVLEIMESTMDNLLEEGTVNKEEFLRRSDVLQSLGKTVLISRFAEFYKLSGYLARYSKEPTAIVLSASLMEEIFNDKWYETLDGGILEALGKLFMKHVRLYVYPRLEGERLIELDHMEVPAALRCLFDYLRQHRQLLGLDTHCPEGLAYSPSAIRALRAAGDEKWLSLVPCEAIAAMQKD